MKGKIMGLRSVEWKDNAIRIIDQTRLPTRLEYIYLKDLRSLRQAIKQLRVRGAPALGAIAALGVYLGIKDARCKDFSALAARLDKITSYLGSARPTARNLFWGLEVMAEAALENKDQPLSRIKKILLRKARGIIEEDRRSCRGIASYGQKLIKDNDVILTVCNAGILATIDYGTALGVIYRAKEEGKKIKVYACETRPLLQGARLTTWELKQKGVEVTLICDNMAATLMRQKKISKVITGADRIAANGDTANKIGTLNLAVLSRFYAIPFYVAAPFSTIDTDTKSGKDIPIEERDPGEVSDMFFRRRTCAKGIKIFNPAFDLTDHRLITAMITDKGIIKPPYSLNIKKKIAKNAHK
jgi:methylthioribose-1-phosphate isomerase